MTPAELEARERHYLRAGWTRARLRATPWWRREYAAARREDAEMRALFEHAPEPRAPKPHPYDVALARPWSTPAQRVTTTENREETEMRSIKYTQEMHEAAAAIAARSNGRIHPEDVLLDYEASMRGKRRADNVPACIVMRMPFPGGR